MIVIVEIVKKTLKSQVYDYLREQIIVGKFKPGERLIEEKIGEALNVSRSPIRESIRMLEKEGFLNLSKTGGVTVVEPSLTDFRYLYECRIGMESLAAYYAAIRRTDEQLLLMKQEVENTARHKEKQDDNEKHVTVAFHDIIIEASANPFLISMLGTLRGVNSFYREVIVDKDPTHRETAFADHEQIWEAIARQDADAAKELMKQHIERDFTHFLNLNRDELEGLD
ncbi:GntR family transcriptional regulator [Oceanobacillus oncorhynchi subsp. incaldanensis]|uniref:Pyruvate dehydrogenase complex repressor n=2 Tax=Oceanobacillus TaxID=182709 RepID=A0A0A1MTS1_9BACI|nr:GntR family transcriptional regulator [Oceanobacillus oncorhynchi]MDM8100646.1 GntR family transcriptional regulator [Oceanobacillus oncorhynchi]UUI41493.1 GntR family transcriptional regulator [Oceanobacillus oncorhynchi]GIO17556.1 GntR family transcriptional regulator [Oceanobacillus oncorhynchi subsp. incaldanensis]CEI82932.1 Pyruvate dehydrogenase complex repressor [Oceanobacillus oncorhynchi]